MTSIALSYFLLGLSALFWPLATLLFKRTVLGGQWLMMTSLLLNGLSIIVYSTFFNTFLGGEYLLVILFMLLSLSVPPMTQMTVIALTRTQGVSRMARMLVLPSLCIGLLMALSVVVGGVDMYRLWIERGVDASSWRFFPDSWRYNLIVAVHFYLYWGVLVAEVLFVVAYAARSFHRFLRQMDEYQAADRLNRRRALLILAAITVNGLAIIVSYLLFPFNRPRPLWAVVVFCVVEGVTLYQMGALSYRIRYAAESLHSDLARVALPRRHDLAALGRQLSQHLEAGAFRDPDISVFLLAAQFHVSADEVVDAIHRLHGTTFAAYIDSLRVEQAAALLASTPADDPRRIDRIAHQCGYLDADALRRAYLSVLRSPLTE